MTLDFPHNIRIRLDRLIFFLRPDVAPLNLLFDQCLFVASRRGALLLMPRPQTFQLQKAEY